MLISKSDFNSKYNQQNASGIFSLIIYLHFFPYAYNFSVACLCSFCSSSTLCHHILYDVTSVGRFKMEIGPLWCDMTLSVFHCFLCLMLVTHLIFSTKWATIGCHDSLGEEMMRFYRLWDRMNIYDDLSVTLMDRGDELVEEKESNFRFGAY